MINREIGKRILKIIENRGISQHQLSELAGIRVENINRIIKGKSNPTVNTLARIAAGLQVPIYSLLGKAGSQINTLPVEFKRKEVRPYMEFILQNKNQKWLEFAYYVSTLGITKQEATTIISTYHALKNTTL